MTNIKSQEQTIYRALAAQIQMGFFDDGTPFPSVMEIAQQYGASYCPAQRALKMLEKDGIIKINRKKSSVIISKPYPDYLTSAVFKERAASLEDLNKTLELISPAVCFYILSCLDDRLIETAGSECENAHCARQLYGSFFQILKSCGNQTLLGLFYDIHSFAESAYLDILQKADGEETANHLLQHLLTEFQECMQSYQSKDSCASKQRFIKLGRTFHGRIASYFEHMTFSTADNISTSFVWEPCKGRTRYLDMIAMEIICKISQGRYPLGTFLPSYKLLSSTYHVSISTMRRAVGILNELGILRTINGKGSQVISECGTEALQKFEDYMSDSYFINFIEILQTLAAFSEPVIMYTFPYFDAGTLESIHNAASLGDDKKALEEVLCITLQSIASHCPLNAVKEIYSKIILQMLSGSILRFEDAGSRQLPGWPKIACDIAESCKKRDASQFASSFRHLTENAFMITRRLLSKAGIECPGNIRL